MANYSELVIQIEQLKKEADKVRKDELSAVIKTIKKQIIEYGISPQDLGFERLQSNPKAATRNPKKMPKGSAKKRRAGAPRAKVPVKYADLNGNTWTGRGKSRAG